MARVVQTKTILTLPFLLVLIVIENVFCVDKIPYFKNCVFVVFFSTDDFPLFFKVNLLF